MSSRVQASRPPLGFQPLSFALQHDDQKGQLRGSSSLAGDALLELTADARQALEAMLASSLLELCHGGDSQAVVKQPRPGGADAWHVQQVGGRNRKTALQLLIVGKLTRIEVF